MVVTVSDGSDRHCFSVDVVVVFAPDVLMRHHVSCLTTPAPIPHLPQANPHGDTPPEFSVAPDSPVARNRDMTRLVRLLKMQMPLEQFRLKLTMQGINPEHVLSHIHFHPTEAPPPLPHGIRNVNEGINANEGTSRPTPSFEGLSSHDLLLASIKHASWTDSGSVRDVVGEARAARTRESRPVSGPPPPPMSGPSPATGPPSSSGPPPPLSGPPPPSTRPVAGPPMPLKARPSSQRQSRSMSVPSRVPLPARPSPRQTGKPMALPSLPPPPGAPVPVPVAAPSPSSAPTAPVFSMPPTMRSATLFDVAKERLQRRQRGVSPTLPSTSHSTSTPSPLSHHELKASLLVALQRRRAVVAP